MCGRVRLASDYSEIKIRLRFDDDVRIPNLTPRSWNVAPTDPMVIARLDDGRRVPEVVRWGLIPSWSKDGKAKLTFNARADSLAKVPAFRNAWKNGKRCLVVVDGFYEWRQPNDRNPDKQAFAIGLADHPIMVMAGLWETWTSKASGETIRSCTVVTTDANDAMREIHDRMPVVLGEDAWPQWLGEEPATHDELQSLMAPCPSEWLKIWPVGRAVGSVKNNGPGLVEPAA